MSTCAELPQLGCCDTEEPPGVFRIVINPIDMFPRYFPLGPGPSAEQIARRTEMFRRARKAIARLPYPATSFDIDYYTWDYGEDVPVYQRTNGGTQFDASSEFFGDQEGRIVSAGSLIYFAPGRDDSEHRFSFCRLKVSSSASFAFPGIPIKIGGRNLDAPDAETISASETRPMVEDPALADWRYRVPADGFLFEIGPRGAMAGANEVSFLGPVVHQGYWGPQ